jgi:hypothetical protein
LQQQALNVIFGEQFLYSWLSEVVALVISLITILMKVIVLFQGILVLAL